MNRRLAVALVNYIRGIQSPSKFIVMEALRSDLVEAIATEWNDDDPDLPILARVLPREESALRLDGTGASVADVRHASAKGLCVVVCEGANLAERQSILGFVSLSAGTLLESKQGLMLLSDAVAPVRRDGPLAAVREAIVMLPAGYRPSASDVAEYFTQVADGIDALQALPALGAFREELPALQLRSDRVMENLLLSSQVLRAEVATDYAAIRARAERVLARRSQDAALAVDFITMLETSDPRILELVSYSEALEIVSAGARDLAETVRQELRDYRLQLDRNDPEQSTFVPWDTLGATADRLGRAQERRQAARELLEFDEDHSEQPFTVATRRKLLQLLRERTVSASVGSALEVALAKAIVSLGERPTELILRNSRATSQVETAHERREALSLAVARIRLQHCLSYLRQIGCTIDDELMEAPFGDFDEETRESILASVEQWQRGALPVIKIMVRSATQSATIDWSPDVDDVALLRAIAFFASTGALMANAPYACTQSIEALVGTDLLTPIVTTHGVQPLADHLSNLCERSLQDGLVPQFLRQWANAWALHVESQSGLSTLEEAQQAMLAGAFVSALGTRHRGILLSPLCPWKAEWLADYLESGLALIRDALEIANDDSFKGELAFETSCQAIQAVTTSHSPPFIRLQDEDEVLLPSRESRMWSTFGHDSRPAAHEARSQASVDGVIRRLLRLQPEAAGHLKCLALGPGASALMLNEALSILGTKVGAVSVKRIEIFSVADENVDSAVEEALAEADSRRASGELDGELLVRYENDLASLRFHLADAAPGVHFALITGVTSRDHRPSVRMVDIPRPQQDAESLFMPRNWQRPDMEQRLLLVPPGLTEAGATWIRLAERIDNRWPATSDVLQVPELRLGVSTLADELRTVHQLALWVATLDRYATRESLERAMGDDVAILHQERRLGTDSPVGLVVSQRAGGPVDRAIGRSLRRARIVEDEGESITLGRELRHVAAQGYGVLALEAATSGTGINELVGHVVGFSMLGTRSTPWPLPPSCRVLLLSLDDHAEWFLGQKRADLLALAIDLEDGGVHGAVIEVKARRSSSDRAAAEALEQLRKTLNMTSFAVTPSSNGLASRVWLNRIAETACAHARESRILLSERELATIECFRRGEGTLEWAGLGLVFGPDLDERKTSHRHQVGTDSVPISIHEIRLTRDLLEQAVRTDPRQLRTAAVPGETGVLTGGRQRRRPEAGTGRPTPRLDNDAQPQSPTSETGQGVASTNGPFIPPVLGWDIYSSEAVTWDAAGPESLSNAHVQVWGSSGAGKTQFLQMLMTQLTLQNDSNFSIADFKNDYSSPEPDDFAALVGATRIDMWGRPGAPYNPLALDDSDDIDSRIIEFRDSIEQAITPYQRIGTRQKREIEASLRLAYDNCRGESRWPTMLDLHRYSSSVQHILGDLTQYEIFTDGPPLAAALNERLIFGLNRIPGNGQTTVLAASFLLAGISLAVQDSPPVSNTLRFMMVVDEAHRVSQFRAVDIMVREGRSKGLGVILATQSPTDLSEVVDTNAQTRICFRLSDATVATHAARKLDPNDEALADRIRTLANGEALVSLGGARPVHIEAVQFWRQSRRFVETGEMLRPH